MFSNNEIILTKRNMSINHIQNVRVDTDIASLNQSFDSSDFK